MTAAHPPTSPAPLRLEEAPFGDPRVQRLVEEVQAHYVVIYGGPDDSPFDPAEFARPQGRFVLGSLGDEPVAMGGWRLRPDVADRFDGAVVAEVKRMYVAPAGRRRGFARALLAWLEQTAREAGVTLLVLETGTMQPEAIALYEAAGYRPTVRFGYWADSPTARYFAKEL